MDELLLSYIWKYRLFSISKLYTTCGKPIIVKDSGSINTNAGADFLNCTLKIGDKIWCGNIEIHILSSHWYRHNHHNDSHYHNVILHIVHQNDKQVKLPSGEPLYTLELKDIISKEIIHNYKNSVINKGLICKNFIKSTPDHIFKKWMKTLYLQRIEHKSLLIENCLNQTKGDWESVTFIMLAKAFGLRVNGELFMQMASSFPFKIIMKEQYDLLQIEALLFGQAGFLKEEIKDNYYRELKSRYEYIQLKYNLTPCLVSPKFSRLRPSNFPTIRLSQLANLLYHQKQIFSSILLCESTEDCYKILKTSVNEYWQQHYHFNKESTHKRKKSVTKDFMDLLIINIIIPLQYLYYSKIGDEPMKIKSLDMAKKIKSEKNNIIRNFTGLNIKVLNAMESQALIHLHDLYCVNKKCMNCAIFTSVYR